MSNVEGNEMLEREEEGNYKHITMTALVGVPLRSLPRISSQQIYVDLAGNLSSG